MFKICMKALARHGRLIVLGMISQVFDKGLSLCTASGST